MAKNLVIVESPTKAKTIARFLGKEYKIESSYGHIRDLPKSKLGVDVEHDYEPKYLVPAKSKEQVAKLKKLAKGAEMIYLATDEDREGEAISWHLMHLLQPKKTRAKRIVFHEITKDAIVHALENPRDIDMHLVDAQQARRVLDRLVGYELSPFLWKKIRYGLSAGRVQSVAVRLIVEREREIEAFTAEEYWTVEARFLNNKNESLEAHLSQYDGEKFKKFTITKEADAIKVVADLSTATWHIGSIEEKEVSRRPLPPFTTSTLQQDANSRLGFSAKKTMVLAQQLYEGIELGTAGSEGLITYMRTDSFNLAGKFLTEASAYIQKVFGKDYAPEKPNFYKKKQKNSQEAHEAIRPTEVDRSPEAMAAFLDKDQLRLYTLIWNRAVASQMTPSITLATKVKIVDEKNAHEFRANGSVVKFPGYTAVYETKGKEEILPKLAENDALIAKEIVPNQHFTEPPARYTEASLVKTLEEKGIGRPSTYAPTMSTIQARGYVEKIEKKFHPTETGILVNDVLIKHFNQITDYDFTAKMEEDLDGIAQGKTAWVPIIDGFYKPFKKNLMDKENEVSKKDLTEETTDEKCEKCGSAMIIKFGRYGKFLACSGYPECKNTKQLSENGKEAAPEETTDEKCEKCGKPMVIKHGRYGKFFGCSGYPNCKGIKNIENKTGVACPVCGKGEIVEKKSRNGRTFYACNQYPDCKNALWSKPTGEKCPDCGSLVVYGPKGTVKCSSKECNYNKEIEG